MYQVLRINHLKFPYCSRRGYYFSILLINISIVDDDFVLDCLFSISDSVFLFKFEDEKNVEKELTIV